MITIIQARALDYEDETRRYMFQGFPEDSSASRAIRRPMFQLSCEVPGASWKIILIDEEVDE